jgi:hypothetical protein
MDRASLSLYRRDDSGDRVMDVTFAVESSVTQLKSRSDSSTQIGLVESDTGSYIRDIDYKYQPDDELNQETQPEEAVLDANTPAEEYNDGQDPTRPLWRVDLRYRYQKTTGDTEAHIGTFRIDMPVAIDKEKGIPGGAIYTRLDIPVAYTNQMGTDNRNGDYSFDLTDSLMQNIYLPPFDWVKKHTPFDAIAVGVQWGFPTGGGDYVSREKFAFAPVFAWKWDLDGPNTFIAPVWRYRVSFGDVANGEIRDDVSELTLQPYINISTKDWDWPIDFITFWETQEIKINFEDGASKESGDVFIPFEVEVGKMLKPGVVGSVGVAVPIYKSDDFDAYDWLIEFRVGFFF